jgi:hypothetical protein
VRWFDQLCTGVLIQIVTGRSKEKEFIMAIGQSLDSASVVESRRKRNMNELIDVLVLRLYKRCAMP